MEGMLFTIKTAIKAVANLIVLSTPKIYVEIILRF